MIYINIRHLTLLYTNNRVHASPAFYCHKKRCRNIFCILKSNSFHLSVKNHFIPVPAAKNPSLCPRHTCCLCSRQQHKILSKCQNVYSCYARKNKNTPYLLSMHLFSSLARNYIHSAPPTLIYKLYYKLDSCFCQDFLYGCDYLECFSL